MAWNNRTLFLILQSLLSEGLSYHPRVQFYYQNEALYGLSADIENFEISIIAKTMFQQNTRLITFKNKSYKDAIRIFWGLALWRNAYIGDILTHKYFVFNNLNIIDHTMHNWLSSYNLVNRNKDSDWI